MVDTNMRINLKPNKNIDNIKTNFKKGLGSKMKYSKLFSLRAISVLCLLLFGILIYVGCGGNSDNTSMLPNLTILGTILIIGW